jgi:anti-sigma regulatory factor (Ser/Thr protein kinase)
LRSGAAAGHEGYFHESAFYGSDEEFVALVTPFLKEAIEAGDPTLVSLGERNSDLLRASLKRTSGLVFLPAAELYTRPAATIRSCAQFVQRHAATGTPQVRMIGEVPHPGSGAPWSPWARYEAVTNQAFSNSPVWNLCPYDTRLISPEVRVDVERTHPRLASADGQHTLNDKYQNPKDFLKSQAEVPPDPVEADAPVLELLAPTASAARAAVAALSGLSSVKPEELRNLIIAASEVVTNARVHGRPPVSMKAWAAPDRLVVSVHDAGDGPSDPFVGLVPGEKDGTGGLGLWIANQMCNQVAFVRSDGGFKVRLTVGGQVHAM